MAAKKCDISLVGIKLGEGDNANIAEEVAKRARDSLAQVFGAVQKGEIDRNIGKQRIVLMLSVQNDNPYDVSLGGMDFTLSVNGQDFAEGGLPSDSKIVLKSKAATQVEIPVDIYPRDALAAGVSVLAKGKIHSKLVGTVAVDSKFGRIRYPVVVMRDDLPVF